MSKHQSDPDQMRKVAAALRLKAHRLAVELAGLYELADRLDPPPAASPRAQRRVICPDCGTEYSGTEYFAGCACETRGCDGYLSAKERPLKPIQAECDNCGRTTTQEDHVGLMCGDYLKPGEYCHGTMRPYPPGPDEELKGEPKHVHTSDCYDGRGPGASPLPICGHVEMPDRRRDYVRTKDGRTLPVTVDELADQAIRDFIHGDDDAMPIFTELADQSIQDLLDGDDDAMPIVTDHVEWPGIDIASTFGRRP